MYSKLQYISQGNTPKEQADNIAAALDGGCQWIQLRFKNATDSELLLVAEQVRMVCQQYHATFIVNDHVHVALEVDADGVHLGLKDTAIAVARTTLGLKKIIGGTANTIEDVMKRVSEKCDYVGLGPFRFTSTKEKLSPVLGISGYINIMQHLAEKNINMPVYAIGGVTCDDLAALVDAGVHGIAVSGVITHHPFKKELVEQMNIILYAGT